MKKPRRLRRYLLAALGLGAAASCAAGFAPISKVDGLRVLAVQADKPYAQPGDTVTFTMTHVDSKDRPVKVVWISGCFDPAGDQYFGCYAQFAEVFKDIGDPQKLLASGMVGFGDTLSVKLPDDIITRRPRPSTGAPYYGVGIVFFAACAGTFGPVTDEGSSAAGSFPIGCFDEAGNRLGAESFVPGFTQVYAFEDGRTNTNPVVEPGLDITTPGVGIEFEPVPTCGVSEDDRLAPPGCGRADPEKECEVYDVTVKVDEKAILEIDPSGKQADGSPLYELVWVDYFTDRGDFTGDTRLVVDAVTGLQDDFSATWIPPTTGGPARIWAVVHDARGGQTLVERTVQVKAQ
jgi:hypothetical protein